MTLYLTECALRIANKGKPVFPCKPDKSPYTKNGFKDATTKPGHVAAMFNKHRDALIGMPTGRRSGVLVMDVDRLEALDELDPELRQEVEQTFTIRTPSGGLHLYLGYETGITNSSGALPPGIDIRGEGGYVVVAPSPGYTIVNRAPIARAPERLLEILRTKKSPARGMVSDQAGAVDLDNIDPIPDGGRNNTLTRIGGKLRAMGYEHPDLEAALLKINAERCTPPLGEEEVRTIAASVSRYAPGKDPEALKDLDRVEAAMWKEPDDFKGNSGKTNWNYMVALVKTARKHGQRASDGAGVEVSIDIRTLTREAGAGSAHTTTKTLSRLGKWIRRIEKGAGTKASKFLILSPETIPRESATVSHGCYIYKEHGSSVALPRAPFSAPRLRRSSPGSRPKRGVVRGTSKVREGPTPAPRLAQRRIGPGCNPVLDYLEKVGGRATLAEIADALGMRRARDLVRKKTAHPKSRDGYVTRLEKLGVVEVSDGAVTLAAEWLDALNAERKKGGEIEAERLDKRAHKRAQEAYRRRREKKPDRAPTDAELAARRERFESALEAQEHARFAYRYERALEAFKARESGPQKNLALMMDGELQTVETLVNSVLAYHRIPPHQWGMRFEEWREPVLEAASVIVREAAPPGEHPLDCECLSCLSPEPRYARPGRGVA
jgi:hypothetical protein